MTKKIVKLIESEDAKNTAAEAKQPAHRSRKSGTVVENTVSPEGIELANVTTEPLNAEPAEGAVPMAFVPAVISTVGEVASPKGPSGEEVPAETVKVPKAAKVKKVKAAPVKGEITSSERRSARGAYAIAQGLDSKNYKQAKITDAELDAFILKVRAEAGDVLGKRSWQRLANVIKGELEMKDLAEPGKGRKKAMSPDKE